MASRVDQIVALPDGRRIAYNEYGDLQGRPVMLLHASFFSRAFGEPVEEAAVQRGIRVITPDRPGVGRSDFRLWTFADHPADMAALADAIGIGSFAVIGVSGGGAHALACAWRIPDRITAVGVVSSIAPPVPNVLRGLPRSNPLMSPARRFPWLWDPQMGFLALALHSRPRMAVDMMARILSTTDRTVLARPAIRRYFIEGMRESVRQGGRGWALEARRTVSESWNSWLSDISIPVHLWQGEEDPLAPPAMGRYLLEAIPGCTATFLPGVGHLWGIDHMAEVLDALMPA